MILDVVYNHLGPDGAYHRSYSADYYNPERSKSDWGEALNFDGPDSGPVRDYFIGTPATGSASSTSTASGWTRPRRSSTIPGTTSWPP